MPSTSGTIDFKAALSFLREYAGHEYRNPDTPGYSKEESETFSDIRSKGRHAVDQFKKMVAACKAETGLDLSGAVIRWDDSTHVKVRSYIWAELVLPQAKKNPESISIFASVSGGVARYRFALETRNDKAKKIPGAMAAHHRFLDSDLPEGSQLVYVVGSDENGAPNVISEPREQVKAKVDDGTYEKVQLCRIVEDSDTISNDDFLAIMLESVKELLPFYKEVIGETKPETENKPTSHMNEAAPSYPKNLVFYGAPGTGKTYRTVNQAVAICLKKSLSEIDAMPREDLTAQYRDLVDKGNISFVTFHQSYSYEDFVIGIFPELTRGATGAEGTLKYIPKNGIFKTICDTARNEPDTNFVLIIDEINRGNISKIFGELITLIEDSKREGQPEATTVLLPYMDDKNINRFSVPNNVYIIGTMNTADRSIQHVDTALRRRFVFEEVLPDSRLFKNVDINGNGKKVNVGDLLDKINRRIKRYFDREHVIGHAYLMPLREPGLTDDQKLQLLGAIFHDRIIPLLQDYFFEDYSKIQKVLGEDPDTDDSFCLVRKVKEDAYDGDDEGRDVYEVAPVGDAAYTNIETYKLMAE